MPKKKVAIVEPELNNIVCEIQNMPPKGEPMLKVEPHEPKKTRKPLSQESLDKLKLAREAAYKKRLELKAQREGPIKQEEEPEVLEEPVKDIPVKTKPKKSKPKKPIVIMEQSSTDSEEEQQVIYVKKKSKPKKVALEEQPLPPPPPQPIIQEPHQPQPVYHQPNPRYNYNPNYTQYSNRRHF